MCWARRLGTLAVALLLVTGCSDEQRSGTTGPHEDGPPIAASQHGASSDAPHPIFKVRTWGEGSDMWEFLAPQFSSPAADPSHRPLYVISPMNDADSPHSTLFFGAHDHVVPVPPGNHGTFSAMWHVNLVTDGSGNLVNSADIDDDGDEEPLTSAGAVRMAEDQGLVTVTGVDAVFPCPVRSL